MSEVNNSYNIEQIIKENERLRKAVSELSILNENNQSNCLEVY